MHPHRRRFVEIPRFSQQESFCLVQPRVGTMAYIFTGVTLRVEFLLKTESGYLRDAEVT